MKPEIAATLAHEALLAVALHLAVTNPTRMYGRRIRILRIENHGLIRRINFGAAWWLIHMRRTHHRIGRGTSHGTSHALRWLALIHMMRMMWIHHIAWVMRRNHACMRMLLMRWNHAISRIHHIHARSSHTRSTHSRPTHSRPSHSRTTHAWSAHSLHMWRHTWLMRHMMWTWTILELILKMWRHHSAAWLLLSRRHDTSLRILIMNLL